MSPIAARLQAVKRRISEALQGDTRPVVLVAVSKLQSPAAIREAFAAGQRAFGENYLQEALAKQAVLSDISIEWHYIGAMQSNKARAIAENFDWVHGIDRVKIADALSRGRPAGRAPLNACLQVNISCEATKGGVPPADLAALAEAVAPLGGLRLRGLMGMASPGDDTAKQRREFAVLRDALSMLRARGHHELDTLSMGMTHDLEAAIAEGATMVRVGTAIFGERPARAPA
jgi:pyridoxal phosphate enzyme (YggS family)